MRDDTAGYWINQFMHDLATRKLSAHTVKAYRSDLLQVLTLIAKPLSVEPAEVPTTALTMGALRSGFARFAATRGGSSVARAWSTWNTWFAFLLVHSVVEGNPMQAIGRPRGSAKSPKPLRGEDSPERLLAVAAAPIPGAYAGWPERDLAIITLFLCTGLRSAEILGLDVSALAGRPGERRLGVYGKGGRFRAIPLDDSVCAVVERYLRSRISRFGAPGPRAVLLVDRHGAPLRRGGLQYVVRRALRAAGISDHVPAGAAAHALRHTFATRLAEDGATVADIARLLGHASMATSQGYIDASTREQRNAVLSLRTTVSVRTLAASLNDRDADPDTHADEPLTGATES